MPGNFECDSPMDWMVDLLAVLLLSVIWQYFGSKKYTFLGFLRQSAVFIFYFFLVFLSCYWLRLVQIDLALSY